MFWRRKRKSTITREEANADGAAMTAFVKPLWCSFAGRLPANDTAPLEQRMGEFSIQVRQQISRKFPDYEDAPDKLLLNIILVAILETNTHSIVAIEKAIAELKRYSTEADITAMSLEIIDVLKKKWIAYQQIPFSADLQLANRVESFLIMANEVVSKNYPEMRKAPQGMIWEMVWIAVIESKTHLQTEVNSARAVLAARSATT